MKSNMYYTFSEWEEVWLELAHELGVADQDLDEFYEEGAERCIDNPEK